MTSPVVTWPEDAASMSEGERDVHVRFMREALVMAELALKTNEVPVGCVFVHDGKVIGRGMNATNASHNGTRHAEFIAISEILSSSTPKHHPSILQKCDLYVTIEPCIMCASLLRQFGVRKVWFGGGNERFGGTGGVLDIHLSNGRELGDKGEQRRIESDYEVSGGWLREEAIVFLRRFYVSGNEKAPEPKKEKKERVLKLDVEPVVKRAKVDG
ncbi:cytidine deaminase-like protein [Calycina marina]|uniref:tRNA(adenine(34)) deaminase n=1 Tax=Calycina marina TaxID=1763456 RepID=A0A9P8CEZ5_9HELO|nr:cytidine deaminase-like protein [Calycina marina]